MHHSPLEGIKVLELARILAGPWVGQTLADLGADVIKVEGPGGDDTRTWGPPFVRSAAGDDGDSAYFHCCNRGKRSVVLDFRTEHGREAVRRLAARADVLVAMNYLVSGRSPRRMGNTHPNIVPYQPFPTADGYVVIAVGNDAQFARLCRVLGCAALADDPRFSSNPARVAHRDELVPKLVERTRGFSREAILRQLQAATVPAGPINTIEEVFNDPQVRHRGMQRELAAPGTASGTVPSVRTPIMFSRSGLKLDRAAPRLGEHSAEVLAEIDMELPE